MVYPKYTTEGNESSVTSVWRLAVKRVDAARATDNLIRHAG